MKLPSGKGWYLWKLPECGSSLQIADLAEAAGLGHVLIKIADGSRPYNVIDGVDFALAAVQALRDRLPDLKAWGWHYVYGDNPMGEADMAVQRLSTLGLDGYVIDAEAQYKRPGMGSSAARFMGRLCDFLPSDLPLGLSSYRFPSYHPQLPWKEFLQHCDFVMPQVYWEQSHNPGAQLRRCIEDYLALPVWRPVIPTGSAYKAGSWAPTEQDVVAFLETARELRLSGANFWEFAHTRKHLPHLFQAIADFDWPIESQPAEPAPPEPAERWVAVGIEGLNIRSRPELEREADFGNLHLGRRMRVLGEEGDWLRVEGYVWRNSTREVV